VARLDLDAPTARLPQHLPYLRAALAMDVQCAFLASAELGIRLLCPETGEHLTPTHSIVLGSERIMYRVRSKSGSVYLFCCSGYVMNLSVIYSLRDSILYMASNTKLSAMARSFEPGNSAYVYEKIERIFAALLLLGYDLNVYLENTVSGRPVSMLRWSHIGHALWHELSGLAYAAETAPAAVDILLPMQDGFDLFGPLEQLYPAFANHILRSNEPSDSIWIFRNRRLAIRLSGDRVTRSHASRIMGVARNLAVAKADLDFIARCQAEGRRLFLLGIRTENRTILNDVEFFTEVMAGMAANFGPCAFVVDGYNGTSPVTAELDYSPQAMAEGSVIAKEWHFFEALRARAQGLDVRLVSTIDRPVAVSLVWSEAVEGFVSVWGAGLAKYRWIANRPGVALTSAWNLSYRSDRIIYSSPAWMENPERLIFNAAEETLDDIAAPDMTRHAITGQTPESYANFTVDTAKFLPRILAFFAGDNKPLE
jgi:hypothetical protein